LKQHLWSLRRCRQCTSSAASLLLLAISILSACGTSQGGAPVASPTSRPSVTATPAVSSQPVSFVSQDGVTLQGLLYGQGMQAIILSNEGDNDSSRWVPVAQRLAQQGYLVLTFNYRYQGNSIDQLALHSLADLHAAIAFMRARNVSRLVLMGASLGALDTVKVASVEKFDAIVVISAPIGFQEVQLQDSELHRIIVPKLFVTSEDNEPFTHDTLHIFDATPDPKVKLVYAGTMHGISIFDSPSGANLLPSLLQFLQHYVPVS
jgi:alpha/beta superfamily hydrolase